MPLALPEALLDPAAYPHDVRSVELVETHLSWVFLTGDYAYKVKKPVAFDFVDFRTLERRKHFCTEELRCNRMISDDIYLGLVPIVSVDGAMRLDTRVGAQIGSTDRAAVVVDWAVQMRQFDRSQQADVLLEAGDLKASELRAFGDDLARRHNLLPHWDEDVNGPYEPARPVLDNFTTLGLACGATPEADRIAHLARAAELDYEQLQPLLFERCRQGFVRECHGDLHLSNMIRLDKGLCAFDCLEFDQSLRTTDTMCDVAFLFMDCLLRERKDLAYAFVDGCLNVSGDYRGAALLPYFARYRSMVRAKVAALRLQQVDEQVDEQVGEQVDEDVAATQKLRKHLDWAVQEQARGPGWLLIMGGISGTGKSYWASRLVEALGAIRIRSDVLRKTASGLDATTHTARAAVAKALYSPESSAAVYALMAEQASDLLRAGENVIVDATCLRVVQREALRRAATSAQARCATLFLSAPRAVLAHRIVERARSGGDPSDADLEVLAWQLEHAEAPTGQEPCIRVDSSDLSLPGLLQQLGTELD